VINRFNVSRQNRYAPEQSAERIANVRGLKVACGDFMRHRRKNAEVFSADECYFDVALLGDGPIKIPCGFDASEPRRPK